MSLSVPVQERYFEDYEAAVGSTHDFGSLAVDEAEVLAFGRRFDPQPFHTDRQMARQTEYGGLIASGWHTAGLMMRLYADHYLSRVATLVSPGVDEVRWLLPVRPGDELSIRVTVVEARRSRYRPDRGIVRSAVQVLNRQGQAVLSVTAMNLFLCREPVPEVPPPDRG